jgi:hypothetical protein
MFNDIKQGFRGKTRNGNLVTYYGKCESVHLWLFTEFHRDGTSTMYTKPIVYNDITAYNLNSWPHELDVVEPWEEIV